MEFNRYDAKKSNNLSVESGRKKRSLVARNNNDNNKKKALSPNERNRELQKWRNSWFSYDPEEYNARKKTNKR